MYHYRPGFADSDRGVVLDLCVRKPSADQWCNVSNSSSQDSPFVKQENGYIPPEDTTLPEPIALTKEERLMRSPSTDQDVRYPTPPHEHQHPDNLHSSSSSKKCKPTRPFKAYTREILRPASFPVGELSESFDEFRRRILDQAHTTTNQSNKNMRRPVSSGSPDDSKDAAYWEKRRKNNEAAKRSRDARRAKEDEIAIRAAYLEQENIKLRFELAAMKNETHRLRMRLSLYS